MAKIDGGEALIRTLKQEGIQMVFAIADVSYGPAQRAAHEYGIRVVGGRHECANVHMADGWTRASGQIAVAMGALGPGVANMIPGVMTAWIEGVPILVIGTQRLDRVHASIRRGRFQHTPQLEAFGPVTKWAAVVPDAERIPEYVREAVRVALAGRPGPVYLEIADEVMRQKVGEARVGLPAAVSRAPSFGPPDPASIEAVAELLGEARLPLLVAGDGVQRSESWGELRDLVEHCGAVVMTTMGSRGLIPEDHPNLIMYHTEGGKRAIRTADVVLAVGTPVGELLGFGRPPHWPEPSAQKWIQIDIDPFMIGVNRPCDVALAADAKVALRAILEAVRRRGPAKPLPTPAAHCIRRYRDERREVADKLGGSDAHPIHPGRLAREVASHFAGDAIACFDGGNTTLWSHLFHELQAPRSLLWTSHFGHLGTGLPYAIGAKLAQPDKTVYLITGDGAFGFNLQELETAARVGAQIIVVISCDYAWGMEHLGHVVELGETFGVKTSRVDYAQVAAGLGCHGERVKRAEDIRPALERASSADKPAVVQVDIDPEANIAPPGLLELSAMYGAQESWRDIKLPTLLGYARFRLGQLTGKNTVAEEPSG